LLAFAGCSNEPELSDATDAGVPADSGDAAIEPADSGLFDADAAVLPDSGMEIIEVLVRLDMVAAPNTRVVQGGTERYLYTDENSRVFYPLDRGVAGLHYIFASHPEARIKGERIRDDHRGPVIIDLERYDRSDNEAYSFQDPGEPGRSPTTTQCGHCHQTINADWFTSPHKQSASNPNLRDLYFGPGGVRESLGGSFGACADCHAPGIDGQLGGRDLADADERAEKYGVHCDVCHRVEAIDLLREPGVAGRLLMMRPTEEAPVSLGAGGRLPLTFGPSHDVSNPRMGMVQRDHFREATICAGCHQHDQAALLPKTAIDLSRWPSGKIPVQSTYEEWRSGPFAPDVPCQECHMPPDPLVLNGGDLQLYPFADIGVQGGFIRPPGSTRKHTFLGPRAVDSGFVEMAAAIFIEKTSTGNRVIANVTVKNVGAGHAIPTGEPLRSLILLVEARCGDRTLPAIAGDVVPDFGGFLARRARSENFTTWPEGQVGDQLRVVRRPGGFRDYRGFGRFGDGSFTPEQKGMPLEELAGISTITSTTTNTLVLDTPLADGDFVYLVRGGAHAGAPGFAFARVTRDGAGNREVPHYRAIDIASDNRLLPSQRSTSTHSFDADCADPTIISRLIHRPYPLAYTLERGWPSGDRVIAEARR
jgi:hypothetical protein